MYLMLNDTPVLYFNFDEMIVETIDNRLLPYYLRDRIRSICNESSYNIAKTLAYNVSTLKTWMSNRVLSLNRDFAKSIYTMFGISQHNDLDTRAKICIMCHGVSITDSYWIKDDTEVSLRYSDVNLRVNHFKDIVSIALKGDNPSFTTDANCPELTTKGLFRKAWIRDAKTKELYLLKSDRHSDNINTHCEVMASHILDCFVNLDHVTYTGRKTKIGYIDKCKNFVTNEYSFVEAYEVMEYCKLHNIDFRAWSFARFGTTFANIIVADWIIMNTDRHDGNYGFMMDNSTGELVSVAPLFDYNLALVSDVLGKDAGNTISQMFNTKETLNDLKNKYIDASDLVIDTTKLSRCYKYLGKYPKVQKAVKKRIEVLYETKYN